MKWVFPLKGMRNSCCIMHHVTWRVCVCVLADDAVYLPEESHLQEYVMNETGIIYRGTSEYISSIPWNYGQVTRTQFYCVCFCQVSVQLVWIFTVVWQQTWKSFCWMKEKFWGDVWKCWSTAQTRVGPLTTCCKDRRQTTRLTDGNIILYENKSPQFESIFLCQHKQNFSIKNTEESMSIIKVQS